MPLLFYSVGIKRPHVKAFFLWYIFYMIIKVLYFASLREEIGRGSDQFEFSGDKSSSMNVAELWRHATGQENLPEQLLVAINQEYTDQLASLSDGDEVAFFPPVTGG